MRSRRSIIANIVVAHIHVSALSVMLARQVGGGSEHGSVQYATVIPEPDRDSEKSACDYVFLCEV